MTNTQYDGCKVDSHIPTETGQECRCGYFIRKSPDNVSISILEAQVDILTSLQHFGDPKRSYIPYAEVERTIVDLHKQLATLKGKR